MSDSVYAGVSGWQESSRGESMESMETGEGKEVWRGHTVSDESLVNSGRGEGVSYSKLNVVSNCSSGCRCWMAFSWAAIRAM